VPRKVGEIIKLIEGDGWYLVAQRGSHRQYRHPAKPGRVTILGKPSRDLSMGLERSILKQAGLIGEWPVSDPRTYVILIEPTPDGGFGAWAPDLPGCVALGDSAEDAIQEMREAITFHLAGLREDGDALPEPSTRSATVEVDAA
jgi:predicted RNA binding protein YcfA (HicA-like mRNA interferase family)/predicted RNase H-like HicB family nuclease